MTSPHSPYRPVVAPVADQVQRPLWSVMIPTYNCAAFLYDTLNSVLAQDPGPDRMEIEVIDDYSTQDDPAAVVEQVGKGRVGFFQQPQNVGHCRNFNTGIERSRGQLIHLLHGDDYVRDGFYRTMGRVFAENPGIGAAFCRYISTDQHNNWLTIAPLEQSNSGILQNWLEKIATAQRLQPPTMVVRRDVYESLGGFDRRIVTYGEDWEMWVRIAAKYPVWYEVEPLAFYRIHAQSLTKKASKTGVNAADFRQVIEINRSSLPASKAASWTSEAQTSFALALLRRARRMLTAGEWDVGLTQVREAIKTSRSWSVVAGIPFLFIYWIWSKFTDVPSIVAE